MADPHNIHVQFFNYGDTVCNCQMKLQWHADGLGKYTTVHITVIDLLDGTSQISMSRNYSR